MNPTLLSSALALPLALALMVGCGGKQLADDSGATGTSSSDGGDGGTSGNTGDTGNTGTNTTGSTDAGASTTADPEAPVVTSVDAWCYAHKTGQVDYIWQVDLTYTDPQGDDTAQAYFNGMTVSQGGTVVAEYDLTCPDPGVCGGSFRQSLDQVVCAKASSYTIAVRVLDEDDNWSEPAETAGRNCPSSDPC
ncbi:MAG: hypothetical protein GXP62_15165 [Oligoflexia bacterium]|nr:hypothetical protein [Oligoflexia bacterium]